MTGNTAGVLATLFALAMAGLWHGPANGQDAAFQPAIEQMGDAGGIDVLTRGPIHEAFAQPAVNGSIEVVVVPRQPPEPIAEIPPSVKPEGENAIWIPGYWAWDDDRQDFIWVSGVWRVAPAGHQWVSGYWVQSGNGYRWVPGFWQSMQTEMAEYYPPPPESIETGPNSPSPGNDYFWVPGVWRWQDARFAWRPGYWAPAHTGWIWVPARYFWCPRGWVFADGYWDYPLADRGLLFAPVYFSQSVWRRPHFHYSPSIVVDAALLTTQLFARPSYYHYYFGDYYAPSYARHGIYPWYSHHRHRYYDPLYTYYRWHHHRHNPHWEDNVRDWYHYYRDNKRYRPPHTYHDLVRLERQHPERRDLQNLRVVQSVQQVQQRRDGPVRVATISEQQRREAEDRARQWREFRDERRRVEVEEARRQSSVVAERRPGEPRSGLDMAAGVVQRPERAKLPRSPEFRAAQTREPRPESKAEPRVAERTERPIPSSTRPETPRAGGKAEPRVTKRPAAPPPQSRPEPRVAERPQRPAPTPRAATPAPRVERPQPAPRVDERPAAPRPQSRPEPRVAERPQRPAPTPRAATPAPRVERPQPAPRVDERPAAPRPQPARPTPRPKKEPSGGGKG